MRAPFLLICCLAGCSPDRPEEEWLVGRWAVDGQSCELAWLVFGEKGAWTERGRKGWWRLDGNRLTLAFTHMRSTAWSSDWKPVEQPLCHTEAVERGGSDELVSRWEDGSIHRLRRCTPTVTEQPRPACLGDCARVTAFDWGGWQAVPPAASRRCRD